jgi:hypothetical protein
MVLARKVRAKVSTTLKKKGPRRTGRPNKDGKPRNELKTRPGKKTGPTTAKNGKRVMDCCWAVSRQTSQKTSPRQSRKESPKAKAEKVVQ